ncbi:pentatricopeptide repeat-containing protein DOT4, chloroplastic-like [Ananas comosus]|uniref:Pentatricopeptide repeat-containing protein DOT4, chloroplastic-like n=1 Tax=Ananas comosus TaxID=4615 RepID=A0A6P5FXL7_ANACO|nr:pentatricopeptide repeat-containing protein DOT4, chloroplastic-like [Ananas comosus]
MSSVRLPQPTSLPTRTPAIAPPTTTQPSSPPLLLKTLTHGQRRTHWASTIRHHFRNNDHRSCIASYHHMLDENIAPNPKTLALVLKACASLRDLRALRLLHNDALRFKFDSNAPVAAALLDGYFACGSPALAHQLFDRMLHRDVVSWTVVISRSYKDGLFDKAVRCFKAMVEEGVAPDEVALISILSAVTCSGWLCYGHEVHAYLIRNCFKYGKALATNIVNMYCKLGRIKYADRIVQTDARDDVGAWTALMAGYIASSDLYPALLVYQKMTNLGIEPSEKTISCALRAVSHLGSLSLGCQIHGFVVKQQFELDNHIVSSLIDMYSVCGAPARLCRQMFDEMPMRDVVSWTTMILAYSRSGEGHAAVQLFNEMRMSGVPPDSVAFIAVLSGCSSSGLLCEGFMLFNSMVLDYGIEPTEEHFACLRNLITKDGKLKEAYEAIEEMGIKDKSSIWQAFLGACRLHGNVSFREIAERKLLNMDQGDGSA